MTYDSTWTGGNVFIGGLSTREEMCEAFLWYWPRMEDLDVCGSSYPFFDSFTELGITNWTTMESSADQGTYYILEPASLEGDFEESISRKFIWTNELKREFEEKRRYSPHDSICFSRKDPDYLVGVVQYPSDFAEYIPDDICAITTTGATDSTTIKTTKNSNTTATTSNAVTGTTDITTTGSSDSGIRTNTHWSIEMLCFVVSIAIFRFKIYI